MKTSFLLVILLSFLLVVRLFLYLDERVIYKSGDSFNITHNFLEEPKKNSFGQYFFTSNVLISLPSYPRYGYGDTIKIYGVIEEKTTETGTLLIVSNPKIEKLKRSNPLLGFSTFVRNRIVDVVVKVLPTREAGLFLGIILGVRDKIDSAFYDQLKNAGVLHVIAASGQNVSILASILLVSFQYFVKRKKAILFTALFILFYSLLAGFDPPIVRASVMALISYGAMLFGKQSAGIFALFLTGWGMVMLSPENITDISFQLSFLSTFGIITVKPIIDKWLRWKGLTILKEDLTTTLSAQIATFPFMIAVFGSYSLITLPVNLLILWTIPPLMAIGVVASVIAVALPVVAYPFILLTLPFLAYFSGIVDVSSNFIYAMEFGEIPIAFICGYYLILIAIVLRLNMQKRSKI